jgi:glycosyltransferase involved in cell wall biosynthesis
MYHPVQSDLGFPPVCAAMRIAYITAGAAGMYCGSCMRDNTLVAALCQAGHDAILIPTYTPIRTDEPDVSQKRVFFGGINVYLEQKFWLFRQTPWLFDRLLNPRWLLRWVSRFAVKTDYSELGQLTVSMLQGSHGNQRKEVARLTHWLAQSFQPEAIILTNALLSGVVPELQRVLGVPLFVTLQGDDIFLDGLPEADRVRCKELIKHNCEQATGFICTSGYYADYMASYLGLPREKMHVIYPGINLTGHGGPRSHRESHPPVIGYFARICPEKGFHQLVDAFIHLRRNHPESTARLKVSGWLGANHRRFFENEIRKLQAANLLSDFEHVECPSHQEKVRFLQSIDVFSVPTIYREPKGLYILEAWANGLPVVQPRHGAFPELIEATGAGVLVEPGQPEQLAEELHHLLQDPNRRYELGQAGATAVRDRFTAATMAKHTITLLEQHRYSVPHPA